MGWAKIPSLRDIKEEYLTEEAKERLRKLDPPKENPFQAVLSVENLKEELLTEYAKKRIRESEEDKLEHPFQYEYGNLVPVFAALTIGCMLAFAIVLLFGGK